MDMTWFEEMERRIPTGEVRTRFAPSPTGYMHVGNLRTALYTWLIARHSGGKFILRIEDTDQGRLVEGATDVIYATLRKCGLTWDEGPDLGGPVGPYIQTERRALYGKYAQLLVEKGGAYRCFCDKERLESLHGENGIGGYDGHCRHLTREEIDLTVRRVSRIVKIGMFMDRYPAELSGGQQQRVAIARTLAPEPSVLFMDEPLSNLDAKLRLEMRYELQRLHVETGSTFVYVTHDQMEAMTLATKICLINNGVLQQYDAPLDVYNRPANLFVADFVGNPSINFVEAKGKEQADGSFRFTILDDLEATFRPNEPIDMDAWFRKRDQDAADLEAQRLEMLKDKKAVEKSNKDEVFKYHIAKVDESDYAVEEEPEITNEDFVLAIRPEALKLSKDGSVASTIYGAMPTGMESTVKLKIGKYLLTGVIFGGVTFKLGEETGVDIAGTDILLFDRKSGKAIAAGSLSVKG